MHTQSEARSHWRWHWLHNISLASTFSKSVAFTSFWKFVFSWAIETQRLAFDDEAEVEVHCSSSHICRWSLISGHVTKACSRFKPASGCGGPFNQRRRAGCFRISPSTDQLAKEPVSKKSRRRSRRPNKAYFHCIMHGTQLFGMFATFALADQGGQERSSRNS